MNDFFQILIYLIIIFAFLNSFFKKKGKEKAPQRPPTGTTGSSGYEAGSQQSKGDILKEIENLFKDENVYSSKRKMESEIEKAQMRKVPVEEHTEDKEWHTEDTEWHSEDKEWHSESKEWHEESEKEHELEQSWHKITPFERTRELDKTVLEKAAPLEQLLMEESTVDNYAFSNLKEKLDSADSLKEYIIISEILGKPKYFRR